MLPSRPAAAANKPPVFDQAMMMDIHGNRVQGEYERQSSEASEKAFERRPRSMEKAYTPGMLAHQVGDVLRTASPKHRLA